jgi:hypothetical protein
MPMVTLVVAAGPGFPQGSPIHRYEITVALTAGGQLDAEAWLVGPRPWPARRIWPGAPARDGDVHYDTDTETWSIRLLPSGGATGDAPLHAVIRNAGQMRPGEYVTIREPGGLEFSHRIVSVV